MSVMLHKQTVLASREPLTQTDRLLEWLQSGKSIHGVNAYQRLGIFRLPARIADLKNAGYKIKTRPVSVTNRFGETLRLTEYFMN